MKAAIGIADLCVRAMQAEGTSTKDARDKIWMMDIDGLLARGRPEGRLEGEPTYFPVQFQTMNEDFQRHRKEIMRGECTVQTSDD